MASSVQRDEKALDTYLDSIIQHATDIRQTIANFLYKLETDYENISWQNVLDNFALLSGQINCLGQFLKGDKKPHLRNFSFLPLMLSQCPDAELEKLTDGRVSLFNHEVVPDYLRTKPEPEADERLQQIQVKATSMNQETAQKQLNNLNRITSNICDIVSQSRQDWEREGQKMGLHQTSSQTDTHALVMALSYGKGLKTIRRSDSLSGQQTTMMMSSMPQQQQQQKPHIGPSSTKAMSSIKTNIRTGGHPYQRP